jgi:hypothetical protein
MWTAAAVAGSAALGYLSADKASKAQEGGTGKAVAATQRESELARQDLAPYRQAGQAALSRLQSLLGIGAGTPGIDDPRYAKIYNSIYDTVNADHLARYGMPLSTSPDGPGMTEQKAAIEKAAQAQFQQLYPNAANETASSGDYGALTRKFSTSDLNADPVYQSGLQFGLDEGTKAIERRAAAGGGYDNGGTLKALTRFGNDYGSTKAGESYGRFTSDQDRTFGKLSGIAGMGSGATTVGVGAGSNADPTFRASTAASGTLKGGAAIAQGNAVSGALNGYMNYNLLSQLTGGGQRSATPTPMLAPMPVSISRLIMAARRIHLRADPEAGRPARLVWQGREPARAHGPVEAARAPDREARKRHRQRKRVDQLFANAPPGASLESLLPEVYRVGGASERPRLRRRDQAADAAKDQKPTLAHTQAQTGDITAGHVAGAWAALAKGGGSTKA